MLEISLIIIFVTIVTICYFNYLDKKYEKRRQEVYAKYGVEK